jgi:glucose-1-phosphatase
MARALDLLRQLSAAYMLGCLSNTNVVHWQRGRAVMQLDTLFDCTFVSCETGLLKPDGEAFQHVIQHTGYSPERILFFDDSQRNVDSAAATGMVACKTVGLDEVYSVLRAFAIL